VTVAHGFTRHARRKMHELGLSVDEISAVVGANDVIERYKTRDGVLLYGVVRGCELHVSVVRQGDPPVTLVTTVYAVDRAEFPDGRTRRRRP
jgi:hypothetical protein